MENLINGIIFIGFIIILFSPIIIAMAISLKSTKIPDFGVYYQGSISKLKTKSTIYVGGEIYDLIDPREKGYGEKIDKLLDDFSKWLYNHDEFKNSICYYCVMVINKTYSETFKKSLILICNDAYERCHSFEPKCCRDVFFTHKYEVKDENYYVNSKVCKIEKDYAIVIVSNVEAEVENVKIKETIYEMVLEVIRNIETEVDKRRISVYYA